MAFKNKISLMKGVSIEALPFKKKKIEEELPGP